MTEKPDPASVAEGILDDVLEQTRVELRFVLGSRDVPARGATALEPGEVLAFDVSLPPRVELLVDEVAIGTGELVEVDGYRGVRIVEIRDASGERTE